MPSKRTLQRLLIAGTMTFMSGFAAAGVTYTPPPSASSSDNDDTDLIAMIALGLAVASSIDCSSNAPSIPGCSEGGSLRNISGGGE